MSDPTQPPRPADEPAEPPPPSPFPESSLGQDPAPAPGPAAPQQQPLPGGMSAGDPLAGAAPAPAPSFGDPPPGAAPAPPPASAPPPGAYPPGYSTPAPPGAGGTDFPPAFGAGPAPGTYQLGSWGARAGAAIIDTVIIAVAALVILIPLGIGVAGTDSDTGTAAAVGALLLTILIFALVGLFYAPVMMSRTNGQTVGRMATNIRVIRAGGEPITFGFAALREIVVKSLLVGAVSSFTFGIGYLIDVLWPLWDDENRALHDFVVNTRTVKA